MTRAVAAWALFDLANTFFAVAMLSFYFPLWVVEDRGGTELAFGMALGASMACVALLMPLCGALSDATGSRMRYLRWTTYGCVAATLLVSVTPHVGAALVLFGFANICYQLGTVFYDALLWTVAAPGRLGQTSGWGAACGYLGSMLGLLLLWPFVRAGGNHAAIAPAGLLFLAFALPSFFSIRESAARAPVDWRALLRAAALRLATTVRSARSLSGLWRYLWAAFFSLNAINTVLVFMAIYVRKVLGFTQGQLIQFFVASQACAVAGSLAFGWLVARWGAKRTLSVIWVGWMGALALAGVIPSARGLWVAGPIIGFCLGATWSTARVLVTELSPKDRLAEMFGLAGLFGRTAAILGPILWGVLVGTTGGHRQAILSLIVLLAVGIWLLQGVAVPARSR